MKKWPLLMILAAGCGGAYARSGSPTMHAPQDESVDYEVMGAGDWSELVHRSDQLDQAFTLSAVDCDQVRALRERICELAERICDQGDDYEIQERCEDGRARCSRARDATAMCD